MASVGIGESGSQLCPVKRKKLKLPRMRLRDDCEAVTHASVPRKIRSAIKKRGSESPMIQNRVSDEVGMLKKNVAKKFKLSMKKEQITKDEKEVAEILLALAGMFSDEAKTDKQGFDSETAVEQRSVAEVDIGVSPHGEGHKNTCARTTVGATCHLSSLDDRDQRAKLSLDESNNPEFLFSKQSPSTYTSSVQPDFCIDPRPKMSGIGVIQREHTTSLAQVVASEVQCHRENKNNGLFLWPSLTSAVIKSNETDKSCPRPPVWFKSINWASQNRATEESASKNKIQSPSTEPKKWKRSSIHVYLSHMIKALQMPARDRLSSENPSIMTDGCLDPRMYANTVINKGIKNEILSSNGDLIIPLAAEKNLAETRNPSLLHGNLLHQQPRALNASLQQDSDVLSLAAKSWGLDACCAERGTENLKHFHVSRKHPTMCFSQSQHCYSTINSGALAQQPVKFPPFLSSSIMVPPGQLWESLEQSWIATSPVRHSTAGERESTNLTKNLPDLLSTIGSKQKQFPQPLFMPKSLPYSNVKTVYNQRIQFGFEANRDMLS